MSRRLRLLLALGALVALGACRVDVTVDLDLTPDGTGELSVTAVADADVVTAVPGLAEDLRFDDAVAAGWVVEGPVATEDGGLTVTLRHTVTSAEEATNLLTSLGPPLSQLQVERTVAGDDTTTILGGAVQLPDGFDSFADADLLAAVGGTPFADDLAASGATPAGSMSVEVSAALPGEIEETTATESDGRVVWEVPLDGSSTEVFARAVQRPDSGGLAGALAVAALLLLVAWVLVAAAFIVAVARARRRRAQGRRARRPGTPSLEV